MASSSSAAAAEASRSAAAEAAAEASSSSAAAEASSASVAAAAEASRSAAAEAAAEASSSSAAAEASNASVAAAEASSISAAAEASRSAAAAAAASSLSSSSDFSPVVATTTADSSSSIDLPALSSSSSGSDPMATSPSCPSSNGENYTDAAGYTYTVSCDTADTDPATVIANRTTVSLSDCADFCSSYNLQYDNGCQSAVLNGTFCFLKSDITQRSFVGAQSLFRVSPPVSSVDTSSLSTSLFSSAPDLSSSSQSSSILSGDSTSTVLSVPFSSTDSSADSSADSSIERSPDSFMDSSTDSSTDSFTESSMDSSTESSTDSSTASSTKSSTDDSTDSSTGSSTYSTASPSMVPFSPTPALTSIMVSSTATSSDALTSISSSSDVLTITSMSTFDVLTSSQSVESSDSLSVQASDSSSLAFSSSSSESSSISSSDTSTTVISIQSSSIDSSTNSSTTSFTNSVASSNILSSSSSPISISALVSSTMTSSVLSTSSPTNSDVLTMASAPNPADMSSLTQITSSDNPVSAQGRASVTALELSSAAVEPSSTATSSSSTTAQSSSTTAQSSNSTAESSSAADESLIITSDDAPTESDIVSPTTTSVIDSATQAPAQASNFEPTTKSSSGVFDNTPTSNSNLPSSLSSTVESSTTQAPVQVGDSGPTAESSSTETAPTSDFVISSTISAINPDIQSSDPNTADAESIESSTFQSDPTESTGIPSSSSSSSSSSPVDDSTISTSDAPIPTPTNVRVTYNARLDQVDSGADPSNPDNSKVNDQRNGNNTSMVKRQAANQAGYIATDGKAISASDCMISSVYTLSSDGRFGKADGTAFYSADNGVVSAPLVASSDADAGSIVTDWIVVGSYLRWQNDAFMGGFATLCEQDQALYAYFLAEPPASCTIIELSLLPLPACPVKYQTVAVSSTSTKGAGKIASSAQVSDSPASTVGGLPPANPTIDQNPVDASAQLTLASQSSNAPVMASNGMTMSAAGTKLQAIPSSNPTRLLGVGTESTLKTLLVSRKSSALSSEATSLQAADLTSSNAGQQLQVGTNGDASQTTATESAVHATSSGANGPLGSYIGGQIAGISVSDESTSDSPMASNGDRGDNDGYPSSLGEGVSRNGTESDAGSLLNSYGGHSVSVNGGNGFQLSGASGIDANEPKFYASNGISQNDPDLDGADGTSEESSTSDQTNINNLQGLDSHETADFAGGAGAQSGGNAATGSNLPSTYGDSLDGLDVPTVSTAAEFGGNNGVPYGDYEGRPGLPASQIPQSKVAGDPGSKSGGNVGFSPATNGDGFPNNGQGAQSGSDRTGSSDSAPSDGDGRSSIGASENSQISGAMDTGTDGPPESDTTSNKDAYPQKEGSDSADSKQAGGQDPSADGSMIQGGLESPTAGAGQDTGSTSTGHGDTPGSGSGVWSDGYGVNENNPGQEGDKVGNSPSLGNGGNMAALPSSDARSPKPNGRKMDAPTNGQDGGGASGSNEGTNPDETSGSSGESNGAGALDSAGGKNPTSPEQSIAGFAGTAGQILGAGQTASRGGSHGGAQDQPSQNPSDKTTGTTANSNGQVPAGASGSLSGNEQNGSSLSSSSGAADVASKTDDLPEQAAANNSTKSTVPPQQSGTSGPNPDNTSDVPHTAFTVSYTPGVSSASGDTGFLQSLGSNIPPSITIPSPSSDHNVVPESTSLVATPTIGSPASTSSPVKGTAAVLALTNFKLATSLAVFLAVWAFL